MPNDAKLGLLAGVIGVIVSALVSANRSPAPGVPAPSHTVTSKTIEKPPAESKPAPPADLRVELPAVPPGGTPAVLPADLPAVPVVRTRKELDATPTSRGPRDADLDP